jgi:hypothetical protein
MCWCFNGKEFVCAILHATPTPIVVGERKGDPSVAFLASVLQFGGSNPGIMLGRIIGSLEQHESLQGDG